MAGWREHLFAFLHRNASSVAEHFELPSDLVIEVGSRVEV
jgi:KUP system potassium uptake protein